jgi:serine/threonine protein kinase
MEHEIYNLNDFDVLEVINKETNFSKIYLARNKKTNKEVILKYFIDSSFKKGILEHISKEIFMNKYLSNTDITVGFKGICIDTKKRYIFLVLERAEFSLYYYLKNVNYTINDFKKIFYELVKIIFLLHSKGIVHNDIKLENFLFIDKKIKIIDFGLSDFLTYSPYNEIVTNYICTEFTKAPDSRKTYETDIYSLGLTAVHLILKSYFKIDLKYINNEIIVIKNLKNKNIITYVKEYDSTFFINKVGLQCYDLIKKMLIYEKELRINIVDVINHPYFEEFEKTPITNFNKIERINNKLNNFHIIQIKNSILPINYIHKYVNYTKNEYFLNMYEIKYKHIHFENYLNQKVNLDKIFDKNFDKNNYMSYSKIFNIDSYVNTIIFLKKEKNFNTINKNFFNEYFLMSCIIFNSIFTYDSGRISYENFNNLCKITYDNFNFIYIQCIKLIFENFNIYFFFAILSLYLDEIIYEYELINPDYLVNLKINCIDLFISLIKEKVIKEINFITLVKYSINTVLANILNKNIIEYNLSPIINSMKLTNEDIKLFS